MNISEIDYPYYSYIPSRFGAGTFSIFVYISLLGWFIQSLHIRCRPLALPIFLFLAHLTTFIELILRGTLYIDILNTKLLYKITARLLSLSPRLLLLANYYCLVELRGKQARRILDRTIDITIPIIVIIAEIFLIIADELSFDVKHYQLTFYLRQSSGGLILSLSLIFYIIWYLSIPHVRRLYILPLLAVSSACVLIQAIYIQIISIPSFFFLLKQNELWFYTGHLCPIVLALATWSMYHPSKLLPPSEQNISHDENDKQLLPPHSSI
ncbi:unnamed protein product [Adineta steineri]|uniref:Uncharacterized protein n=1 Tax=Adineta steineri TaxID=433720 RepID=A0A814ZD96_9BILA|nr:unnamed protein product [Adineta steineri]CAF1242057.1 unnamed protein product [Adineta steineri]CAF1290484.1 unnamed protein product [Adineta steineri]CAF3742933.1 unnamed protein product [Adineta steineri]CAF3807853.1 unnamed protein product [Adineta steineri]